MNVKLWLRAEWDRVAGVGLVALGAVMLLLGYHGVKGTPFVADQMSYVITGGLGGLFCLGLGVALLISADLRDEWRKLDRIEAVLTGRPLPDALEVYERYQTGDGAALDGTVPGPRSPSAGGFGSAADPGPSEPVPHGRLGPTLAVTLGGSTDQVRKVAVAGAVGLAALIALIGTGWRQAAVTAEYHEALRGLAFAAGGVLLAGCLLGLLTLSLRARVMRRASRLLGGFAAEAVAGSVPPSRVSGGEDRSPPPAGVVAVAEGLRHFHRSDCAAVAGVAAVRRPPGEVSPDLRPCPLCRP